MLSPLCSHRPLPTIGCEPLPGYARQDTLMQDGLRIYILFKTNSKTNDKRNVGHHRMERDATYIYISLDSLCRGYIWPEPSPFCGGVLSVFCSICQNNQQRDVPSVSHSHQCCGHDELANAVASQSSSNQMVCDEAGVHTFWITG